MADETPVSDVLCEAMEYLSKLGSNLRTRSENLKEKRIRKDKLKNSHAVQKAANKVLLICELSKKSLDNVETGVRKVLSLLEASSNKGAKALNDKTSSNKSVGCYYFHYGSRKLRIAKKVNTKHYMSVKVMTKRMTLSMQEKYPVYHDCKLYRHRKRALHKTSRNSVNECGDDTRRSANTPEPEHKNEHRLTELQQITDIDNTNEGSKEDCNKTDPVSEKSIMTKEIETPVNSDACIGSTENVNEIDESELHKSDDGNDKNDLTLKTNELGISKNTDSEESLLVKNKASASGDSSNSNEIETLSDNSKIKSVKHMDTDLRRDKTKHRKKENESKTKKYKHIVIPDDSSDDDSKENQISSQSTKHETSPLALKDEKHNDSMRSSPQETQERSFKKRKKSNESQVSSNKSDSNDENQEIENTSHKETEDNKPLIRCVNISKLLKPDVLGKNTFKPVGKVTKIDKCSSINEPKKTNKNMKTKDEEVESAKRLKQDASEKLKDEEEYWFQKRKEVTSFKAKDFTINITRLPKISELFLVSHRLKSVVEDGIVICKIRRDENTASNITKDVDEVKSVLLDDSESDTETLEVEAEKVKNCLLKDSDSDTNKSKECTSPKGEKRNENNGKEGPNLCEKEDVNTDKQEGSNLDEPHLVTESSMKESCDINISPTKIKNALLIDSDSDKNEEIIEQDGNEISLNENCDKNNDSNSIKNALLNDSDSDKNDNQENKEQAKEDKDEEEPFTNKELQELDKTVSDIIKNALLNDSDSENRENNLSSERNKVDETQVNNQANDNEQKNDVTDNVQDNSNVDSVKDGKNSNKPSPSKDPESVKSALLNDSSDDSDSQSKKEDIKSRKTRHAKKSVHAKEKLLNNSSSSESEHDGRSTKKDSQKSKRKHRRKIINKSSSSSSSSNEDLQLNPKKKLKLDSKHTKSDESDSQQKGSSSEHEGSTEGQSNSRSSKMVRSKAKPSGSSGQSSDNQDASDKDIDGLTNLNNLNKSHRRRDSTSTTATNNTQDTDSSKKKSRSKMISEDLLPAESSSDSISDNAGSDIEDLPPIPVAELNGGTIDHLAKDDLLGDSDSSGSHKDKTEESQNLDDSEEDDNVISKRRKANAISSDSEVGSSLRKDRDVKLSDFEDSEDDSEPTKRSKQKRKGIDSDSSNGSSDGGKKKRRRIKQLNDSDNSGSDTENEGRNKHGRKNIRKVMGKNQLEEATKKAAREEKERIARITERQKLYNNLEFDESGKPDEVVLEKVVLDFDPETKEPLIEVDRGLVKKLKPHQANGIKFMWDACFESVKRIKKDKGSGCILAHCMGLGKTLQVISLTHTLLTHGPLTGVNRVLVVCPLSTVLNWVNEFRMWLGHAEGDFQVDIYELSRYKQNSERAYQLRQWFEGGGVCVLGYEMFRNLSADNTKKYKKKMLKSFQDSLVDPGPDLVVCDEGHLLKNEKTSLSQSMNRVKTRRRIVLTGTPLQNNLKEYYCMVQFVKPNLLGKYNEYLNRFVNPITNGQYTDSTEHDIRIMKRRSHVLHKMLDGAVQRRDYGVLAPFLPPKLEFVLFITLSEVQIKLYQYYLDNYSRRPLPGKSSGFLFPDFQSLQRIWTHPLVLKYNSERYEIMQQKKREREEEDSEGSLVDFIDDDSTPDESSSAESTDDMSDVSDDSRKKSKKKNSSKKGKGKDTKVSSRRGTRANPVELEEEEEGVVEEVSSCRDENPTEWWMKLVSEPELDDMRHSHKLVLLFDILRQCEAIGDKLLVFSQSLYSLDLIEHFLGKVDEATQEGRIDEKLGGHVGSWSQGVDYFRLDGSTSCENRSIWCKNFNREDNPRARLFLISTRAGGLGINLVAANRVVIFDVSWNPSHDVQSIFRVYRFGQKKPCYVYRFLAMGTMEEKIYERQVTKQAISKRVIDEQQIDRHYAENDLAELYTFQPRPDEPRPLPSLPKDRLFAEMLREHDAQIYKYHEHDSLLENKEEETLSEEERKAAWEDFENEKNKPPPAPFPAVWPMHNGMMGVGLLQQQQLAYAALASMLRKDMPNISDQQIRDMLPLIYNSNPGLMQKINEMYKYAQPGMMNPGLMNPVMNPGGGAVGAAGALGGSSGLQYEPPWQRQHQQQQQLRLQQLMQQQNQMGAKFYAGGLGSRDPVAMALQQQRAREIMLAGGGGGGAAAGGGGGQGAGRPRGRPPLQPRTPAAPSADVVNLDSD